MKNDRFSLFLPLCIALISFSTKLSEAFAFSHFSISHCEPCLPLLIGMLFISSLALFSLSLSLTQITPITAHSSSPAPLSLPLHTSLQQTHTHTFRAAFQERHLFVSVCVELRLQEASVYKTHSYLLYSVCVCVSQRRKTTEKYRESEYHQTCQEQVRLTSHQKK